MFYLLFSIIYFFNSFLYSICHKTLSNKHKPPTNSKANSPSVTLSVSTELYPIIPPAIPHRIVPNITEIILALKNCLLI